MSYTKAFLICMSLLGTSILAAAPALGCAGSVEQGSRTGQENGERCHRFFPGQWSRRFRQ